MDSDLLSYLYHRLIHSDNARIGQHYTYSIALIVLIYFFGVLSDRSTRWAYDRKHWPLWLRRLKFPSYSQVMKRLKTPAAQQLIEQLNTDLRQRLPRSPEKICDGKPLVVGGYSKDPDASWGKVPDGWARGYRLHLIVDSLGAIEQFQVTAMHTGEPTIMRQLVQCMDMTNTILRGDSNYNSNPLYQQVALQGGRLIAPRKKPGVGIGHGPQHPDRLRAIKELETDPQLLKAHKRRRNRVEQELAHLTNLPFGLAPLPNFVRRLRRVRMWVMAKITLYHLYLNLSQHKMKAA